MTKYVREADKTRTINTKANREARLRTANNNQFLRALAQGPGHVTPKTPKTKPVTPLNSGETRRKLALDTREAQAKVGVTSRMLHKLLRRSGSAIAGDDE